MKKYFIRQTRVIHSLVSLEPGHLPSQPAPDPENAPVTDIEVFDDSDPSRPQVAALKSFEELYEFLCRESFSSRSEDGHGE